MCWIKLNAALSIAKIPEIGDSSTCNQRVGGVIKIGMINTIALVVAYLVIKIGLASRYINWHVVAGSVAAVGKRIVDV